MATPAAPAVPFLKYRLTIQPLTAVQIGTDEAIAPYEYDIELHEADQYGVLTVYDLNRLLSGLTAPQRAEFRRITDALDMRALRKWLRSTADPHQHRRFRVVLTWEAARELYDSLDNLQRDGRIYTQLRDARSQQPVIPGSSIKGAIRTAVVDRILRETGDTRQDLQTAAAQHGQSSGARLEGILLGHGKDLRRDPFRQLSISDALFEPGSTCVERMSAVRRDSRPAQEAGICLYREVLMGRVYFGQEHSGAAELRLQPQLADGQTMAPQFDPRSGQRREIHLPLHFSAQQLLEDCNRFYQPMCLDESCKFRTQKSTRFSSSQMVRDVMNSVEDLQSNQCVIRLGHHSHFDAVTVHGRLQQKPRRYSGNIRWFAGGYIPLGWAVLTIHPYSAATGS